MTLPAAPEPSPPPPVPPALGEGEDRVLPAVVYGLFLIGLVNGLTILIGLVIAYLYREKAGPRMRTHYVFQSRSCWMGLAIAVAAAVLILVGIPLSLVLVGIPIVGLGVTILSLVGVWFAIRCVLGLFYLYENEAYPRPDSWLI